MSAPDSHLDDNDFGAIADALHEQREAIVLLLTELDAQRNGLHINEREATAAVMRISTSITTIADTINAPGKEAWLKRRDEAKR